MTHDRDPDDMGATDHDAGPRDESLDPALERVTRDLDALYTRSEPPTRLLLARDWSRATSTGNRKVGAPMRHASQSVGEPAMSRRERPIWSRRIQVFAATAAALVIVGLLAVLLTHVSPGKSPVGAKTTATPTGDAALLQQFAQQGGAAVVLNYRCLADAKNCNAEAILPQLESTLRKRLA
ncbi:MAG TPA: hypothetical protein VJN88_01135, partial [Ktedonobacterales bacterium]|nr:hypothetical protein [Ktedonobacterales bacterium]